MKTDYYKNYNNLLNQLTSINYISYEQFSDQFNQLNDDYNIFVIEEDNKIIATGTLLIEHKFIHNCSRIGHIEDIIVDKNYRGKGYGRKIVEKLLDKAEEFNCYKVILDCDINNKEFYEKLGFNHKNIQMSLYFL